MADAVIKVGGVNKTFGSVRAVRELSFTVTERTCFGFLGPNGAGKTTMMKMVYGMTERDSNSGSIDIFGYDPQKDALAIKYISGVVGQEDNLDEELNVIQNLLIYARFYNMPAKAARQRIDELLDFMELTEKAKSRIRHISGGMKRRLVIARALLNEPKLLLLDEPTTGLDPQVRHLIWDKIRQLKRRGTTVLLTTHYMEEAFQLCDEVLIMHQGSCVMQGNPRQLLAENIEKYVLEMPSFTKDEMAMGDWIEGMRVDRATETKRVYSNDPARLQELANSIGGGHYYLREANLEDLFLKATGRGLNEKQ